MHPRPHPHAFVARRRNITAFLGGQTTIRWELAALWPGGRAGCGEGGGSRPEGRPQTPTPTGRALQGLICLRWPAAWLLGQRHL